MIHYYHPKWRKAEEYGRTAITGTYDLAIAEIVMQLQEQEALRFDKTYVSLVSFYIEPVLLYSFRKYIGESGEGDHEMHVSYLSKIGNFFIFKQPDCARWLIEYHNNLL